MKRLHPNHILFFLLLIVVALTLFARRDYLRRNLEFLPGMVESIPAEAQRETRVFSDHRVMREPVQGTVPQGFRPIHYRSTPEEALRAGLDLPNPVKRDSVEERERGAFVFTTFCQPCHGSGGTGDGRIVQHGFPAPPSLLAERAIRMKEGQMFHLLTYGQGNMPAMASQVDTDDRWRVIRFVRSLQSPKENSSAQ